MNALVHRKETSKQTPTLYLVYGYREIGEPHRWYVGSTLYMREQARDNAHRRQDMSAKKFHEWLIEQMWITGKCFDELVEKVILEIVWGTPSDAIDRENIHMDRLDSIRNGFNKCRAGLREMGLASRGKKRTKEHREKMSKANRGRKRTKEQREKIKKAVQESVKNGTHPFQKQTGENHPSKKASKEGTHQWLGENNPVHKRVTDGTHNFFKQTGENNPMRNPVSLAKKIESTKQTNFRKREQSNKTELFNFIT